VAPFGVRRGFGSAALLAFLIFLPNLLWEAHHGWPQIEVVRNAQLYKNVPVSPIGFIGEQIAFLHPIAFPLWLAGLAWYFFSARGKPFRFLGWAYLVVMAIFIIFEREILLCPSRVSVADGCGRSCV
jgi:hypothetical protein